MHVVKERQKLEKAEHMGANVGGLVDETVEIAFLKGGWVLKKKGEEKIGL